MAAGTLAMGRPKANATDDAPQERPDRETVIHLKGSPEYNDWLTGAHKKTRLSKAAIFRIAVEQWAERNGLEPPPEI